MEGSSRCLERMESVLTWGPYLGRGYSDVDGVHDG